MEVDFSDRTVSDTLRDTFLGLLRFIRNNIVKSLKVYTRLITDMIEMCEMEASFLRKRLFGLSGTFILL